MDTESGRKKKNLSENAAREGRSTDFDIEISKRMRKRKSRSSLEEIPVDDANLGAEIEEETKLSSESVKGEEEKVVDATESENLRAGKGEEACVRKKKKKRAKIEKPGVCYLSRIPPRMDPATIRHMLSQYGEVLRVYLAPEGRGSRVQRRKPGKFQQQGFSEGWVEFADKRIAKQVAEMLNGEQIGGRKRSQFYFDLWNIKYLSKLKWDDLTGELAYKSAIREQKLALELSAAKRERDFYLKKVDQSLALSSIEERMKKKQKPLPTPKVIRQFPQTKPVADKEELSKPQLSKDILAGVFGGS